MCKCFYVWLIFVPVNCSFKPDFNCWNNFALSCVDKVTTGTLSFVSVISDFPYPVELVITQSLDHVNSRFNLQLTNGISRVL